MLCKNKDILDCFAFNCLFAGDDEDNLDEDIVDSDYYPSKDSMSVESDDELDDSDVFENLANMECRTTNMNMNTNACTHHTNAFESGMNQKEVTRI